MTDVFISYKREHRPKIEKIAKALKAEGLDVWYDAGLQSGQSFSREIDERTQSAKAVLTCWTEGAAHSNWVIAESHVGLDRNVLVSIQLEPCRLPPPFNTIHADDLSDWNGETDHPVWRKIVEQVKALQNSSSSMNIQVSSLDKKHMFTLEPADYLDQDYEWRNEKFWIDRSNESSPNDSIGDLLYPNISNAQYERKHPIYDRDGTIAGFITKGMMNIGYTYNAVYSDIYDFFAVFHNPFGSNKGLISVVEKIGTFIFSGDIKFGKTDTLAVSSSRNGLWNIKAYKLIKNHSKLLCLSTYECLIIDFDRRNTQQQFLFQDGDKYNSHHSISFDISKNENILAVITSVVSHQDPISEEYYYNNIIRLYELSSGKIIGLKRIEDKNRHHWKISFSKNGQTTAVKSDDKNLAFNLKYNIG